MEVFTMKKSKKFAALILTAALSVTSITAFAAEIPRESAPLNATEEQIVIVENLIGDILDEVAAGNIGYTQAAGYANTRVRKAVVSGETNGNGYGILSPIAQNAILDIRDMYLRADVYNQAEEQLKVLLADIIGDVENGKDLEETRKEAYLRIYQSVNPAYTVPDITTDFCYVDAPTVDRAMFNRARKLLDDARGVYIQKQQ
jgi:hypothetical protein